MPPVIPVPPDRRPQTRIVPGRVDKNGRPYYVRGVPRDTEAAKRKIDGLMRGVQKSAELRNQWKTTGIRHCKGCDRDLPIADFGSHKRGKYKGQPYTRCGGCRERKATEWKAKNPNGQPYDAKATRIAKIAKYYGLTVEQYDEILSEQNFACAICESETTYSRGYKHVAKGESNFMVDHCHTTGKVRGLLCGLCNRALGLFRDNPESCERAAEYLRRSQSEES